MQKSFLCYLMFNVCRTDDSMHHLLTLVVDKTKGQATRVDKMVFGMHPLRLLSLVGSSINISVNTPEEQATDNMEESVTYTHALLNQQQRQQNEFNGPTNAPPGDVELSTVGSSSHSHIPPSQHSSIPSSK